MSDSGPKSVRLATNTYSSSGFAASARYNSNFSTFLLAHSICLVFPNIVVLETFQEQKATWCQRASKSVSNGREKGKKIDRHFRISNSKYNTRSLNCRSSESRSKPDLETKKAT